VDDRVDREQRIVIRWRTRVRSQALGSTLESAYPTDEVPEFDEALKAIDAAETQVWGDRDPTDKPRE
jgi:hypothetical protein